MAAQISSQLESLGITPDRVKRLWLHQANLSMNQLISRRVLSQDATPEEAPTILDEYANTRLRWHRSSRFTSTAPT
ncbi:MAG: 3-oxoacyl-[acyl-carrier-protein] synthase III C-terminal domain-containing protein [Halioglobus sp.]